MSSDARKTPRHDDEAGPADLATLWQRHGNKVLIAITAALLVFWAVKYRRNQAALRMEQTRQSLAGAWLNVQQLSTFANQPPSPEADKTISTVQAQVNQSVQAVLDDADVTTVQAAWAWMARGEMYWDLAHRPAAGPTPPATTAPASQPGTDNLGLAANAYSKIVNDYAAADPTAVTIARYGLAAIAEERGDAAQARKQYKALIETPNFTDGVKPTDGRLQVTMAEARLKMLNDVEKPTLLLPATQPVRPPAPSADLLAPSLPTGPVGPPAPGGQPVMPPLRLGTSSGPQPTTAPATQPAR